jgi:hypothetical protein
VTGPGNTIHRGAAGDKGKGNGGDGVRLAGGSGSTVRETTAYANGRHGISANGTGHYLLKNQAGDAGKGNGDDGLHVEGSGVLVQENRARHNRGDGIDVSGGSAGAPNRLRGNQSNTGNSGGASENTGAEYRLLGSVNNAGGGNKADGVVVPKTKAPVKCASFPATNATASFAVAFLCE